MTEICKRIAARGIMDFNTNRTWRDTVRGTLELNSSDSRAFNGHRDWFYSVEGIGQGVWGLRGSAK